MPPLPASSFQTRPCPLVSGLHTPSPPPRCDPFWPANMRTDSGQIEQKRNADTVQEFDPSRCLRVAAQSPEKGKVPGIPPWLELFAQSRCLYHQRRRHRETIIRPYSLIFLGVFRLLTGLSRDIFCPRLPLSGGIPLVEPEPADPLPCPCYRAGTCSVQLHKSSVQLETGQAPGRQGGDEDY